MSCRKKHWERSFLSLNLGYLKQQHPFIFHKLIISPVLLPIFSVGRLCLSYSVQIIRMFLLIIMNTTITQSRLYELWPKQYQYWPKRLQKNLLNVLTPTVSGYARGNFIPAWIFQSIFYLWKCLQCSCLCPNI